MSSVVVLLLATGCGTSSTPAPPTPYTPTTTMSDDDTRNVVKRAFLHFWSVSNGVIQERDGAWRLELAVVAVEPQLSRMVDNLNSLKAHGLGPYGTTTEYVTNVEVKGDTATVTDCQDASQSGQLDIKTGKRTTVGIPRNPVMGRMQRDTVGEWRVAEISFPGGTC
jgi:hypothetical protein